LECYDEALDIDNEYAELWFNRGEVLKELKRYDDALNSLNKALKLEPDCKPALKMKKELIQIME
jgi:tetratricopeptide (TPR) repeat protein